MNIIASDLSQTVVTKAIGQFHGGVFPPENKDQSMELPLGELPIPEELVFPLSQHMGAPAHPFVKVGDKVLAGQKIAAAVGNFSAAIHASSSGEVSAIEERVLPHPSGMNDLCIVIKTDGKHEQENLSPVADYTQVNPKELIEQIREAGITGLGGAGFPTAVKLNPQSHHEIDTLILNGTECEPYITADHSLMLNYAREIIEGAKLLAYILGKPQHILIGVEDNKPDAIEVLAEAVKNYSDGYPIQIITFPTKYPSGGEKQLIQLLTGKEVPSGAIPASMGIVMQNIGTAVAAYEAIVKGQPLISRITTFVGESLQAQRNIKVLLGTPVSFVLEQLGYQSDNNEKLIMGGPMMGFTLDNPNIPLVKSTNCIIAPSKSELPPQPDAQECIRCGMCAEACPASLLPQQLYWYSKAEEYERAQNYQLFDCIECGACSFVCPSNIPLVQYYRAAKGEIRKHEQEKVKSDHARQRFEFRKQRLQKAEEEKAAKREARKKAAAEAKRKQAEKTNSAATAEDTKNDPVAAAMARVQQQQNNPDAQKAKLERTISSSQDRIKKLQEKLTEAEDDAQKDKLAAQIKQIEVRLQAAQQQLGELTSASSTIENKASAPSNDAASAAIAKAKTNTAALAAMSDTEKQQKQLKSLEDRLAKAKQRLSDAEKENSEHIDAFKNSVTKLEAKLADVKAAIDKE